MPNTMLPWAVVLAMMPLVKDRTPTRQVCGALTMSTRSRGCGPESVTLPDHQTVPLAKISRAGVPLGAVGCCPGHPITRSDLDLGRQRFGSLTIAMVSATVTSTCRLALRMLQYIKT